MTHRISAALAAVLALGGCSYPAEDFATDFATASCQLYDDCDTLDLFGFASVQECADTSAPNYLPETMPCADYDRKAAADCVDGVELMTCEDLYASAWPDACDARCG